MDFCPWEVYSGKKGCLTSKHKFNFFSALTKVPRQGRKKMHLGRKKIWIQSKNPEETLHFKGMMIRKREKVGQ